MAASLETLYHWRNGVWTPLTMSEQKDPPIGDPKDFQHLSAFEREKLDAQRRDRIDPEAEFREEMRRVEEQKAKAEERRQAFLRGENPGAPPKPARLMFLLCAKGKDGKIKAVGMYSTREQLAVGLSQAVMSYTDAGYVLGPVDLDLSLKVDQPPVELP